MNERVVQEPPFDPRWLDLLAEVLCSPAAAAAGLVDLYVERRFEVRVNVVGSAPQVEECRTEGAAARWDHRSASLITAITGTSPRAIGDLLAARVDMPDLVGARPIPPPDMDSPRGWMAWASDLASRMASLRPDIRFLSRRAVVVNREGWTQIVSPDLVRVRTAGEDPRALLAVWNHPQLGSWLADLAEPAAPRRWRPDPGLRVPVLMTGGTAGALLHELVGHLAEADIVAGGDSPLGNLGGAIIAPATLDLVDDPSRNDLPGAFDHDDEGVPAEPLTLVEKGCLAGLLCDRRLADELGGEPGRGRRASWSRPPVPRMSNLVIAPGQTEDAAVERDLRRGLVVSRIGGATVDPLSARTVIRVERGWEIRNGRRRRPLAQCELIGGVIEVLAGLDAAIGSEPVIDWRLGWCVKEGWPLPTGSVAPSMLVHDLEVL